MPVSAPLDDTTSINTWDLSELNATVFSRFSKFAEAQPNHLAVVSTTRHWTYAEILDLALQVAAHLETDSPAPIGVLLPAGGRLAAGFLGALAAGRPYVPLDPSFPPERNRLILQQAGITSVISDGKNQHLLLTIANDINFIDIDTLENRKPSLLSSHAESVAYIIYTSGSTGQPKGVYQHQRGLLHDIYQFSHALHINTNDKLTWLYSPSVNGAIRDIYGALLNGATLYAFNVREIGLHKLANLIEQAEITIFHAIPPLLRAFLQSSPAFQSLVSVRVAYISGDRLFASDVDSFYRYFPRTTRIYNGIGSTECATLYRHWFLHAGTVLDQPLVPVGYAIPERHTRVVDAEGNTVAIGEVGEVEVCSEFIAQGYWNNKELTLANFKKVPENPKLRRFLTGDLAREHIDGMMEYIGRKDGQVKIRGYRVELGAIEAELRHLVNIKDAAVLVKGTTQTPELVAYLVGDRIDTKEIHRQLSQKLPAAFVPNHYDWLTEIPRLANFKTDLAKLKLFIQETTTPAHHIDDPQSLSPTTKNTENEIIPTREDLHCCWNESLNRTGAIDDNVSFINYGGDSLKALTLLVLLEKKLQRTLPIQSIHYDMTINSLLQSLSTNIPARAHLYIVADRGGIFNHLLQFTQHLPHGVIAHVVPMPGLDVELVQPMAIPDLGQYVAQFIMQQAPSCPIHLLGFSFGARVAFEAGCALQQQGVMPHSLMMGDMGPAYGKNRTLSVIVWHQIKNVKKIITRKESITILKPLLAIDKLLMTTLSRYLSLRSLKHVRQLLQYLLPSRLVESYERTLLVQLGKRQIPLWKPSYFHEKLTVFVAKEGVTKTDALPDDLGWSPYTSSVEIVHLSGKHTEFTNDPSFSNHLNNVLNSSIQRYSS